MDYELKDCQIPATFKYKEVFYNGKPTHEKYDSFSIKHPAMPLSRRAKIFSKFDALKGFNEAVNAKEIRYEKKRELSEEDADRLNQILNAIRLLTINGKKARENNVRATITYYVPCNDADNEAYKIFGFYEEKTGTVYKVDVEVCQTMLIDDCRIPIKDIIDIECKQAEEKLDVPV